MPKSLLSILSGKRINTAEEVTVSARSFAVSAFTPDDKAPIAFTARKERAVIITPFSESAPQTSAATVTKTAVFAKLPEKSAKAEMLRIEHIAPPEE